MDAGQLSSSSFISFDSTHASISYLFVGIIGAVRNTQDQRACARHTWTVTTRSTELVQYSKEPTAESPIRKKLYKMKEKEKKKKRRKKGRANLMNS